jgi:hypothetical protein
MSRRRRRPRKSDDSAPAPDSSEESSPIVRHTELIAAAFLLLGAAAIIGVVLLVSGGGDGADGDSVQATQPPAATVPGASPGLVSATDLEFITELARLSIESLPAGEWPNLYDDFTSSFQAGCSLEEFTEAGQRGAVAQGTNLELLAFVSLEVVDNTGGLVRTRVLGEITGKSQYLTEEFFQQENGAWKIAHPPGITEGCGAFNQITPTPSPPA